jgi:hypothetical protein
VRHKKVTYLIGHPRKVLDVRNDDAFGTNIQRPKNLRGLMTSYAHDRRHPKAFASADVMFYFLGFRASMLTVNESKIKSRRCAHLYQRRCRRFDDKPVHGFATEKPLAQ